MTNVVYSGASSLFVGLLGFFLIPFIISRIGVIEFGLYSMLSIFAISGYLSLFELGFQSSISKYIAQYNSEKDYHKIFQIINSSLLVFTVIGIALMVIGFGIKGYVLNSLFRIPEAYKETFSIALSLVFISYLYQFPTIVYSGIYQGLQRFDILKGIQTFSSLMHVLMVVILLSLGYGYLAVVCSLLLSQLVMMLVYYRFTAKVLPDLTYKTKYISINALKEIWSISKYLLAMKSMSIIYYQTPRLLVSVFMGPVMMASYEIIMKLPRFLKSMLGFINSAVMPAASELSAESKDDTLRKLYFVGLKYQNILSIPVILGAMYFSVPFLEVWVGKDFTSLADILRLTLIWNLIVPFISYGGSILLGMNKRLKELMMLSFATTLVSVSASFLLLNSYQLNGVIIGFVLGVLVTCPFYLNIFLKEFKVNSFVFLKLYLSILIISLVPLITNMLFTIQIESENLYTLMLKGVTWCVVYWSILYFVIMNYEERKNVNEIFARS